MLARITEIHSDDAYHKDKNLVGQLVILKDIHSCSRYPTYSGCRFRVLLPTRMGDKSLWIFPWDRWDHVFFAIRYKKLW
jgi:hypothetical protein